MNDKFNEYFHQIMSGMVCEVEKRYKDEDELQGGQNLENPIEIGDKSTSDKLSLNPKSSGSGIKYSPLLQSAKLKGEASPKKEPPTKGNIPKVEKPW